MRRALAAVLAMAAAPAADACDLDALRVRLRTLLSELYA